MSHRKTTKTKTTTTPRCGRLVRWFFVGLFSCCAWIPQNTEAFSHRSLAGTTSRPVPTPPFQGSSLSELPLRLEPRRTTFLTASGTSSWNNDPSAALERTKQQLERLQRQQSPRRRVPPTTTSADGGGDRDNAQRSRALSSSPKSSGDSDLDENATIDPLGAERERLYAQYAQQPANTLKDECQRRRLPKRGTKPDMARRLARYDLQLKYGHVVDDLKGDVTDGETPPPLLSSSPALAVAPSTSGTDDGSSSSSSSSLLAQFGSIIPLSAAASRALTRAGFVHPSPIQAQALKPLHHYGQSAILHAETGSGKTLAYLLPITERLWNPHNNNNNNNNPAGGGLAVILTPTRELAAQVAGVAQALAPPGTVRLITHPTNLAKPERGNPNTDTPHSSSTARLFVGSAKAIEQSLFGASNLPAPPTPKPVAMQFLQRVRYLVLDEVDRLLLSSSNSNKKSGSSSKSRHIHERPAAIVTAAVARHSLGKAQVVGASATVGRALRRELARVLGLTPAECPPILRGADEAEENDTAASTTTAAATTTRVVTVPDSVQHYIVLAEDATPGTILTNAYQVIQKLGPHRRMLLVLTRGFGISTSNAVGALQHFQCQPPPTSLLDALQTISTTTEHDDKLGSESLIEQHRHVSKVAKGIGEALAADPTSLLGDGAKQDGYLLVTGEDTVRGLHLDGLEIVLVAGRPQGVDEYTHIAGRTGRAGTMGRVINIVDNAASLRSWEKMLLREFQELNVDDVAAWD